MMILTSNFSQAGIMAFIIIIIIMINTEQYAVNLVTAN